MMNESPLVFSVAIVHQGMYLGLSKYYVFKKFLLL